MPKADEILSLADHIGRRQGNRLRHSSAAAASGGYRHCGGNGGGWGGGAGLGGFEGGEFIVRGEGDGGDGVDAVGVEGAGEVVAGGFYVRVGLGGGDLAGGGEEGGGGGK